jgi:hypothetical protein
MRIGTRGKVAVVSTVIIAAGWMGIDHPLSFPQHPNDECIYWSN